MLNTHITHYGIQIYSAWIVSSISIEDNEVHSVVTCGGIEAAIQGSRLNWGRSKIQEHFSSILCNIGYQQAYEIPVAQKGGLKLLMDMARDHMSNAKVVWNSFLALFNLAADDGNEITIVKDGGLELLMDAYHYHKDVEKVTEHVCGCLWNLSVHPPHKTLIPKAQGLTAIIVGMMRYPENLELQKKSLNALKNLTMIGLPTATLPIGMIVRLDDTGRPTFIDTSTGETSYYPPLPSRCSPQNVVNILQLGGLGAVITAYHMHSKYDVINRLATTTITNLAVSVPEILQLQLFNQTKTMLME